MKFDEYDIDYQNYFALLEEKAKAENVDLHGKRYLWEFCEHCYERGFCDKDDDYCPRVEFDGYAYGEAPFSKCKYEGEG